MKNIIPASDYRRLKLLNLLFFAESPIPKKEAAKFVECSINTLNADIETLNANIPDGVAHIDEIDRKLTLRAAPKINFDYLTAYMISNSHLFQLALSAFNEENQSISEWAEKNFVSRSTFYVKLAEVDTFLSRSRLILNTTPLEVQGNEINVRFFYYHLFSKCYPYSGWIIDDFGLETPINTFIQKFEKSLNIFFSLSARTNYAIAIAVTLKRIKQGHPVRVSDENMQFWHDVYTYHSVTEMDFSDLEAALGETLSQEERYLLIIISALSYFTYVNHEQMTLRLSYTEKYQRIRLRLVEELITILNERVSDTLVLKTTLVDYFARFYFVQKSNLLLDVDYFTKKFIPDTVDKQKIISILQKYESIPDYRFIKANMDIIATYIHDFFNAALLMESYTSSLHIKIIAKNGFIWEEFLKTEIRRHYSEDFIVFCDELNPSEHWAQHDFIISDFPLPEVTDVDVLVWHMPPTKRDFADLDTIVREKYGKTE
ncbi:helix-turn-helix domain-containing protein [Listeria riparia]|uniref:Transcriptional antiterminator BglG n=1 Tax=Listeria riparia FSL S10-1204 TaxID=1265816 RepID=W7CYR3_9LIST|nr:helix-turn-helix domain-containing protein [Listeria riparia]EUJ44719.1 transcriptional antiterminator BglG [Listeria riparia FSL S10-1204]